jgi:D-tyrosyl-tRNA(Tyr) deacylase
VVIDGDQIAAIGIGLLVLVGIQRGDGPGEAARLAERLLQYRVFADVERRMNLDVRSVSGSVLLVPQFTLAADTRKGNRPGFSRAAAPELGERLFASLVAECRARYAHIATGRFGADMQVRLTNDGPVTFWLEVAPAEDFSA